MSSPTPPDPLLDAIAESLRRVVREEIERALASRASDRGEGRCLSVSEAAEYLNISPRTVGRLTAAGQIRAVRLSAKRRGYRLQDLGDYLERQAG